MLDALCQGVESWWSINATDESQAYSKAAIETIIRYKNAYLKDFSAEAAEQMLLASNYAGRAINITQTTAPHAMSYKLTSLYQLPHGHAATLCLPAVWQYMTENPDKCIDKRGADYIASTFGQIAKALDRALGEAKNKAELSFIEVKCAIGARDDLGRPTTTAMENKINFMESLQK